MLSLVLVYFLKFSFILHFYVYLASNSFLIFCQVCLHMDEMGFEICQKLPRLDRCGNIRSL